MASNAIVLPPWASRVFFRADDDNDRDRMIQKLAKKLNTISPEWWQLGLMLKLPSDTLGGIKTVPSNRAVTAKFLSMLEYWVKNGKAEERTWGFLASAVEDAGNRAVAEKIRKRQDYLKESQVPLLAGDLSALLKDLAPVWKRLANNLYIPISISGGIDNRLTADDCLMQTITAWVNEFKFASFEVLIRAIESHAVSNRALAISMSENVEVLRLLKVPDDDKEPEEIRKKLKEHIEKLQKTIDAKLANLPKPPLLIPEEPMEKD